MYASQPVLWCCAYYTDETREENEKEKKKEKKKYNRCDIATNKKMIISKSCHLNRFGSIAVSPINIFCILYYATNPKAGILWGFFLTRVKNDLQKDPSILRSWKL